MRIIKRISDNVVLFAGAHLTLDASGVSGPGMRAPGFKPDTVVLEDAEPPAKFLGSCYTHIAGTWAVLPGAQAQIDAHYAAIAPSEAQVVAGFMAGVQAYMDRVAVSFGYDDLISVITYANEPAVPRYQNEGIAFRAWRSLVWAKCETVFAAVKAGTRTVPTPEQLLAELPAAPVKG